MGYDVMERRFCLEIAAAQAALDQVEAALRPWWKPWRLLSVGRHLREGRRRIDRADALRECMREMEA